MSNEPQESLLKRELGLFSATILVIANMIGTGIFTTSGLIMEELGNPKAMLFCWLLGGLYALCGALCYGELGARFPRAGGEYVFLRESFGRGMAFLSGWISLIVGFSAPIAAASIAFANYFLRTFGLAPGPGMHLAVGDLRILTLSAPTGMAIGVILILSLAHAHSLRFGSRIQNAFTLFKIGLICVFAAAGLVLGRGSLDHFSGGLDLGSALGGKFAVSLIFVAFAYSGWNAAAYLGGEIKRPERNIPMALLAGTSFVIAVYLILNIVYIYALPPHEMSGVLEIGAKSAVFLFGDRISTYFTGAVTVGLLSVISAMIMAGPRVYYAMSRDGAFFEAFANVNPTRGTPTCSIFLQSGIAILMVLSASFDDLLLYIGFTLSLSASFTVVGLFRLRIKHPAAAGSYRTLGYPVTPLLFVVGNAWIIYFSIKSRPLTALYGFLTLLSGALLYFYFIHGNKRRNV